MRTHPLNTEDEIKNILGEVLGIGERAQQMTRTSALLGAVPELDSMAVVAVMTSIEERFGFAIADDEICAQTFDTLGSLIDFVQKKL